MKLHFPTTTPQIPHNDTPEPRALKKNSGAASSVSQPRNSTYEKVIEDKLNVVRRNLVSEAKAKISSGYYTSREAASRVAEAILESESK